MSRKYPLLYDKAWLTQKYVEEKISSRAISELIGCGTTSVENGLKRFKIPARSSGESNMRFPLLRDKAWLENMYLEKRLSSMKIGKVLGCDSSCVTRALESLSIPRRVHKEARLESIGLEDKAIIELMYVKEKKSAQEVGEYLGCSNSTVYNALPRLGIQKRCPYDTRAKHVGEESKVLLESMYITKKKCVPEISEELNCSCTSVYNALRRHGIPIRSLPEARSHDSGFIELNNRDWLYQKYVVEERSGQKIADLLGCHASTVLKRLARECIACRTPSEIRPMIKLKRSRTRIEVRLEEILNSIVDCIEYTGDGGFWIPTMGTHLNPDFIIRDRKIAIEANGDYWHSPLLRRDMNATAVVTYRKAALKKAGWRLVVFWESDILREDAGAFVLSVLKKEGIV